MRIEILSEAEDDLVMGAKFYERMRPGLGEYFLNSLYSDIDSLLLYAGIHRVIFGFHRAPMRAKPSCYFRGSMQHSAAWNRYATPVW